MTSSTVASDGGLSLDQFQTVVQQNEGIFGPLLALSSQGSNNIITLEVGQSPEQRVQLEIIAGTPAPDKPEHEIVCTGNVLVGGSPVVVAAYRRSGPA
jgi:hypothetical protein